MKKVKKCRKCKKTLGLHNSTYYRLRNYIYLCNNCDREEKRIWAFKKYKKNPQLAIEKVTSHDRKSFLENPIKYKCKKMCYNSKKRATIMQISHNCTIDYLLSIAPKICPILKIDLNYLSIKKDKNSPSLDRIDPQKGYIIGNVQIISYLANLMKSFANKEDLINFAEWVLLTFKK